MYEIDISGFNLFFNNLIKRMSWLEIITVDCDFITRLILTQAQIIVLLLSFYLQILGFNDFIVFIYRVVNVSS